MNKIVIDSEAGTPINNDDILAFEERLKIKIPTEFRKFLLEYNGGYCLYDYPYNYEKYEGIIGINSFLGIRTEPQDWLFSIENFFLVIEEMHGNRNWFPFGCDSGGYIFCLSLKQENYGTVFLMRTDEEEPNAFRFIANDFNEFITGLKTDKPVL